MKSLDANAEEVQSLRSGASPELVKVGGALADLRASVQRTVTRSYNQFVGIGAQDLNAQEVNRILTITQNKTVKRKSEIKSKMDAFKRVIGDDPRAADLIRVRRDLKGGLYSSYDLILQIIPKMRFAVRTITNSIISPDDFTKKSIAFDFADNQLTEQQKDNARKEIKGIIEKYELEDDLGEDIEYYLTKGERFFACLSMNEEIKTLLKENATEKNHGYETLDAGCLNESVGSGFTATDTILLNEGYQLFCEGEGKDKVTPEAFRSDLGKFLSENFVIGKAEQFLTEDVKQRQELAENPMFTVAKQRATDAVDGLKGGTTSIDNVSFGDDLAILKRLPAENVVTLKMENKVFGYLYLDTMEDEEIASVANAEKKGTGGADEIVGPNTASLGAANAVGVVHSAVDIDRDGSVAMSNNPRLRFIAEVFANRLSKKQNISLLRKDEAFKAAIYHTLATKRVAKGEKLRVTFFTPDQIVHIDRRHSIFDNILFFAKLYIATLVTILMQNIVRGADKRAYYVDVGLENDAANAMQSAIRDIKSKEIAQVHNLDLTSTLNLLGDFNDYYIPTVDGERPITIENVDGLQNISLDNEFLNFLSNNIFSGIGIPAAYLTEVDNVEFAKALAMQNSRFIRDIVAEQGILGRGYSELLQKLWKIHNPAKTELSASAKQGDKDDGVKIDISSLEVRFPPPVSLNMTNLNDQINNLNVLVDSLSEILDVPEAFKEQATVTFKRMMYKKFLPNLNWEDIDQIVADASRSTIKEKLRKDMNAPTSDDGDGAGLDDGSADGSGGEDDETP
jgi:hypothetical protein